jgi:PAS domain S-box-containing protein
VADFTRWLNISRRKSHGFDAEPVGSNPAVVSLLIRGRLVMSKAHHIVFNTGEPAFAVDRHGSILAWNSAAEETFGYSRDEAVGQCCWKLMRGRDMYGNLYCTEHCPRREMAIRHKNVNRCRMKMRTAAGKLEDFTVSALVLHDGPGSEVLISLFNKDSVAEEDRQQLHRGRPTARNLKGDVLTPRETQVLKCLADGHSTAEVATMLSISVPTVRNHVEHTLHKLNAHSRLEAVAVARKLDII